jgi:hypothetical protein
VIRETAERVDANVLVDIESGLDILIVILGDGWAIMDGIVVAGGTGGDLVFVIVGCTGSGGTALESLYSRLISNAR